MLNNNQPNGVREQRVRAYRRAATPMELMPGALAHRVAGGGGVTGGGATATGQRLRMQGKIAVAASGHACGSSRALGNQVAHGAGPLVAAAGAPPAGAVAVGGSPLQLQPGIATQQLIGCAVEPVAGPSPQQQERAPTPDHARDDQMADRDEFTRGCAWAGPHEEPQPAPQAAGDPNAGECVGPSFYELFSELHDDSTDSVDHLVPMHAGPPVAAAGPETVYGVATGGHELQREDLIGSTAQLGWLTDAWPAASPDMLVSQADSAARGAVHPDAPMQQHLAAQQKQHRKRPADNLYIGVQEVPLSHHEFAGAFHSAPPGLAAGTSHTTTAYL